MVLSTSQILQFDHTQMDRGSSVAQDGDMAGWVARQVFRGCKASKRKKTVHISLQEYYLRDDIPCGSPACRRGCHGPPSFPAHASHYLIPDASALRHFWEILELPQLTAVVFLSSVLKEVQMQFSGRHWRRLRALFADRRRGNLYFDDDHCIYTKPTGERGSKHVEVKEAARWFDEHLEKSIPIIIMTGHVENTKDSEVLCQFQESLKITGETDNDLKIMNAAEYVQHFWSQDATIVDLCNSLVQSQIEWKQTRGAQQHIQGTGDGRQLLFKDYLSATTVEEGLQDGSLHAGIFHVSKNAREGGFVRPSNKGEAAKLEVWVPAGKFQNRALHGDLVAVRVLSHNEENAYKHGQYGAMLGKDLSDETTLDDQDIESLDKHVKGDEQTIASEKKTIFIGEVVGILQRLHRDYAACLDEIEEEKLSGHSKRQEHLLCVPMDNRIPMVHVTTRQRSHLVGQRFVIRIDSWDADSKLPRGHVVRILGPIGDLETENRAILVENEINILPFTKLSLQELPIDTEENPWLIPAKEYAYRRDLRFSHRTYSIDPPGSKDVDDCLSIGQLDDNTMEVGVHIADVSYFVNEGSLLDLEAFSRGTTVYLVGNTYHMLPAILSENLCSLRYGKDRLAVSVIWTVDPQNDFEILDVWFGRTIIRSRQQMFYAQAQAILDEKDLPDGWEICGGTDEIVQVQSDLSLLANFSQVFKSVRESKGALELVSAEMSFEMGESQEPLNVESKTQLPMNWIVAEMMIQANSYVARRIYESFGMHALLRRHPPPKLDNFNFLLKCCEAQGLPLNTSSNKALASSLNHIQHSTDPTVQTALKVLATRAMSEAEYVAAGEVFEPYGLSHYGLALEFYTHFTSPIRRYADIVVHRMLISSCKDFVHAESDIGLSFHAEKRFMTTELSQMACHLNERHRASKRAQKECNELHLLMYLQKHAQAEHGVVIEVQPRALVVFVPKYDLRGWLHLQDKTGKIIFPAKNEETVDDMDVLQVNQRRFTLRYSEDSISVIELESDDVLYEYKRMTSVWVQMKADGSRAHSPTLRLRLLCNEHPTVQNSMSKSDKDVLQHPMPRKFKLQFASANIGNYQTSGNIQKERKQTAQAMSLSKQIMDMTSKEPVKVESPNEKLTVHDFLVEFDLMLCSASSIYLEDEGADVGKNKKFIGLETENDSNNSATKDGMKPFRANDLSTTMAILKLDIAVTQEEPQIVEVRKAWQKKLFQAATQRIKQDRAVGSLGSTHAYNRKLKELRAREEARLLYKNMGFRV